MNATDHKIEITESGLAFCVVCKGGEIELEESCASRVARLFAPTPPAGAEDDWPNTSGRVVDAAGTALPSSLAGAEPSPEEAASREYTDLVVALIQKHKGFVNMSEYEADVSNLAALIARHFAPLRAELEQLKGHHQRDEAMIVQRTDEVRLLRSDLTAARARIGELEKAQTRLEGACKEHFDLGCEYLSEIMELKKMIAELDAQLALANAKAEQDRSFREWCYVTVGTDNLDCLKTLLENGMKDHAALFLANAKYEEARRVGVKCFDESHPDAIG